MARPSKQVIKVHPCPRCGTYIPKDDTCWVCFYPSPPYVEPKDKIPKPLQIIAACIYGVIGLFSFLISIILAIFILCTGMVIAGGIFNGFRL